MRFSVLASSSKANCTFVEYNSTRILLDCGISCRQVCLRLESIGVDPNTIQAILVTHEHQDHIKGCSVFSRKFQVPVYATHGTAPSIRNVYRVRKFSTDEIFELGDIGITPFEIVHDAAEPVAFVLSGGGFSLGHATDLGRVTPLVKDMLRGCQAVVLESNYDVELLQTCEYPWELKQRIASSHGHLGNVEAAKLIRELMHYELKHVILGHLSENSNNPEIALAEVSSKVKTELLTTLLCGSRTAATPIIDMAENVAVAAA